MRAAWYEKQGPPSESLVVGEMPEPRPAAGELRIRIAVSGVNPGDVKKRQDTFGVGMPYPRVIPHSDGAGTVDEVGNGVDAQWIGKRVWCFGAQSYRPSWTRTRSQWIKNPSKASPSTRNRGNVGEEQYPMATDQAGDAVSKPLRAFSRSTLIASLCDHASALAQAGDIEAARIAHEAAGKLLQVPTSSTVYAFRPSSLSLSHAI
jgi:hypothetical protein